MKIKNITVENIPPIKSLIVTDLGNIVIFAGANGSGKSTYSSFTRPFKLVYNQDSDIITDVRKFEDKRNVLQYLDISHTKGVFAFEQYLKSTV